MTTITPDDEREAREWLKSWASSRSAMAAKYGRTILALLDAPRMPRPENLTNDVLDAMHAAHSVSLNTHEQFTFVRNAMRAAYRALYDHYTAPPQPKKVEAWAVVFGGGQQAVFSTLEGARLYCSTEKGRIVKLVEDRDGK